MGGAFAGLVHHVMRLGFDGLPPVVAVDPAVGGQLGRVDELDDLAAPRSSHPGLHGNGEALFLAPCDRGAKAFARDGAQHRLELEAAKKGVTHFIDALSRIAPNVQAALVGDGPEEPALRAQIERLGLEGRVHFAGFVPQARMRLFYSAADLVCLPSLEEGWPNVLMESFACGCPVVASDVGGVSDIIALTQSGLTAPPGDSAALAHALEAALERTPRWDREETARRIGQHTLARTAERYCATCAEVSLRR